MLEHDVLGQSPPWTWGAKQCIALPLLDLPVVTEALLPRFPPHYRGER